MSILHGGEDINPGVEGTFEGDAGSLVGLSLEDEEIETMVEKPIMEPSPMRGPLFGSSPSVSFSGETFQSALANFVQSNKSLVTVQEKISDVEIPKKVSLLLTAARLRDEYTNMMQKRSLTGNINEAYTQSTKTRFRLDQNTSTNAKTHFIRERGFQVQALHEQLGIPVTHTTTIQWGSLSEVAAEVKDRAGEWPTNKITSWLSSIVANEGWEGTLRPYESLFPHFRERVGRVLDFGCGSGNGAMQVKRYFNLTKSQIVCYDLKNHLTVDNQLNLDFSPVIAGTFNTVLMVNVLHHVKDLTTEMDLAMSVVEPGGTLYIKDHFVGLGNILLATLVHQMYEGRSQTGQYEELFFRPLATIVSYLKLQGWGVSVIPLSGDLGDNLIIAKNMRESGITQVQDLQAQVDHMQSQIERMQVMIDQRFSTERSEFSQGLPKYKMSQVKKVEQKYNLVREDQQNNRQRRRSQGNQRFVQRQKKIESVVKPLLVGEDLDECVDEPVLPAVVSVPSTVGVEKTRTKEQMDLRQKKIDRRLKKLTKNVYGGGESQKNQKNLKTKEFSPKERMDEVDNIELQSRPSVKSAKTQGTTGVKEQKWQKVVKPILRQKEQSSEDDDSMYTFAHEPTVMVSITDANKYDHVPKVRKKKSVYRKKE